jgi:transposase-like protein
MGRKSNYRESYKREAVVKAQASGNVSQTARELGISNKSLHAWIKQYGEPLDIDNASVKELSGGCDSWSGSWRCARVRLRC